jgi:hypothetical protein
VVYSAIPIAEGCGPSCSVPGTASPTATDLFNWKEGAGPMASAHLDSLSAKHAQLESAIFEEMQRPMPDSIQLAQWKKEKLRLKEQIAYETTH